MAFQLTPDAQGDYKAATGAQVTVGVAPATTKLGSASYNNKALTVDAKGRVTFTMLAGSEYLNLIVDPPDPPELWSVVEWDGAASQKVEDESLDDQVVTLILVGV